MTTWIDETIEAVDQALRVLANAVPAARAFPHPTEVPGELAESERLHAASLMRVNHVGEVCAQALYRAQALGTKDASLKASFEEAALEEADHLAWTARRLEQLESRPSLLNPLWYGGAFALGLIASRGGDRLSLGFVVETERQVEQHLASHLDLLPEKDSVSRAIVTQMRDDEARHGQAARDQGARDLPAPVRLAMRIAAKVMTRTAYWI